MKSSNSWRLFFLQPCNQPNQENGQRYQPGYHLQFAPTGVESYESTYIFPRQKVLPAGNPSHESTDNALQHGPTSTRAGFYVNQTGCTLKKHAKFSSA